MGSLRTEMRKILLIVHSILLGAQAGLFQKLSLLTAWVAPAALVGYGEVLW